MGKYLSHSYLEWSERDELHSRRITSRLNSENACYHKVRNLMPSHLQGKKVQIKIQVHKTIILPVVLDGCKTWSLTLTDEYD
jgi:hypothetical protein